MSLIAPHKCMGLLKLFPHCKYVRLHGCLVSKLVRGGAVSELKCWRLQQRYYAAAQQSDDGAVTKSAASGVGEAKPITFKEKGGNEAQIVSE